MSISATCVECPRKAEQFLARVVPKADPKWNPMRSEASRPGPLLFNGVQEFAKFIQVLEGAAKIPD